MKKALLLGLGLTLGAGAIEAQAGFVDALKPYGTLVAQGAAVTVGGGAVIMGFALVVESFQKLCRYMIESTYQLNGAQDFLKDCECFVGPKAFGKVVSLFVAKQSITDATIAAELLLEHQEIIAEQFGACMTKEALLDIEDTLNVKEQKCLRILPHLWRASMIKKCNICIDKIKAKRDFVRSLIAAIEQTDVYQKQLAQKQAQERSTSHCCCNH